MPEENVTKSLDALVAEGKAFKIEDKEKIKELPNELKKKIQEFVAWASIDEAYGILNGQSEHNGIIIAGTESHASPHNDVAMMINNENKTVELLVACRVFNQETGVYLDDTRIMTLVMQKDDINDLLAFEEEVVEETAEEI